MKKPAAFLLAWTMLLVCAGCGDGNHPERVWLDYYQSDDMPWGESRTLTLPEFPGVTFTWTPDEVTADDGKEVTTLFTGMPVENVYLYDLTGDGKPEFCATVSIGSGIVQTFVRIYDYASGVSYELRDAGFHDYALTGGGRSLQVMRSQNPCIVWEEVEALERGTLVLVPDGEGDLQLAMES